MWRGMDGATAVSNTFRRASPPSLLEYVPLADPLKISRLRLRNLSGRARRLSVTVYVEWVLGASRGGGARRS